MVKNFHFSPTIILKRDTFNAFSYLLFPMCAQATLILGVEMFTASLKSAAVCSLGLCLSEPFLGRNYKRTKKAFLAALSLRIAGFYKITLFHQ